ARLAAIGEPREALDLLRAVSEAIAQLLAPRSDGTRRVSVPALTGWPRALEEIARRSGPEIGDDVLDLARDTRRWAERAEAVGRVATCLGRPLPLDSVEPLLFDPEWTPVRRLWTLSDTLPWFASVLPTPQFEQLLTEGAATMQEAAEQLRKSVLSS